MLIARNGIERNYPDFLVIGGARCGTSSLYFYLREHPEIFMPEFKEPHFFSYLGRNVSPHPPELQAEPWQLALYLNLFDPAFSHQIMGEASASYLHFHEDSIENIKKVYGDKAKDLKLIAILRNPIERAWSYYMLRKRSGYTKSFFEATQDLKKEGASRDFHNFMESGLYYRKIKAYMEEFPNLKIFLFEEFKEHTSDVVREIFEFLNLNDVSFLPENLNVSYNRSGECKNQVLRPLYRFLYEDGSFKKRFKSMLPYMLRQRIKIGVGDKIIAKTEIPLDVRQYLKEEFSKDIRLVEGLFLEEGRQRVVSNWLA